MAYVNYVEFNVADVPGAAEFYSAVFGWKLEPFGEPDYLVAQHGDAPGIDTGIMKSQDGVPRTVATITVESIDDALSAVTEHGGTVVVEKFAIPTVGYAAYFTDPGGLIVGLHEYDPDAS